MILALDGSSSPAAIWFPVEELRPWADNPRINDAVVADVADSIKRLASARQSLAQSGLPVIAGHTRLKAAIKIGLKSVPVRFLDLSLDDAHLLALADNGAG